VALGGLIAFELYSVATVGSHALSAAVAAKAAASASVGRKP
jgi:hypothetical protein